MTSINFNSAATTALRTLQATNSALETSQNRVSTGLKIGEAKDNAAYWSISTSLQSDNKALNTVKDSLSLGAGAVDTAYQGMKNVLSVLDEIKSKVTAASGAAANKDAIQLEIDQLLKQLTAYSAASTFAGENWLTGAKPATGTGDKSIVSGFTRDGTGSLTLTTITVSTADMRMDTILGTPLTAPAAGSPPAIGTTVMAVNVKDAATAADYNSLNNVVEAAITKVKTQASTLGAIASRIDLQTSFVSTLVDTIDKGVSDLIDADLSEESTRLQALQTKQQLGIQALSIANTSTQNILSLFRS